MVLKQGKAGLYGVMGLVVAGKPQNCMHSTKHGLVGKE